MDYLLNSNATDIFIAFIVTFFLALTVYANREYYSKEERKRRKNMTEQEKEEERQKNDYFNID